MSAPQITVTLVPPLPGQSVEDFNAAAFQYVEDQAVMAPQMNAIATYVNTKADEIAAAAVTSDEAIAAAAAAEASKNAAAASANNAASSASSATSSKNAAATSATNAATSASTANTKAGEAATSATAAASSATTASTKAGEAATSASAAASSASTASTAATNAGNSASAASTAATNAGNSATAAAGSASTASTKANEASTSASNAATSETNAASSAAAAAQSAQDAADIVVGDVMSDVTPQALGTAAPGTGLKASREDHVHQMPSAADVGAEPAFAAGTTAQYRRGDKTWQALNKSAVGLGNVDNTSDAAKPVSTATQTALNAKADLVGGKVPEGQLPAIAITDVFSVASQSAMLALTAERGDIAVRTDINKSFALSAEPASTLANWIELRTPTDAVLSVAGRTGTVTLTKSDVGLGNVDNTSDAAKPVSTATQTALNGKANTSHSHGIADVSGLRGELDTIPGNAKSGAYTLVLSDAGKSIDTTTNVTIPSNSSVAFAVGTTVMVTNTSSTNSTISINTDTLRMAGTTNTGTRTLAGYGVAVLRKVNATTWFISGAGLS